MKTTWRAINRKMHNYDRPVRPMRIGVNVSPSDSGSRNKIDDIYGDIIQRSEALYSCWNFWHIWVQNPHHTALALTAI
jgi:hypothetical protein